jgi:exonuclease SbcD
MHGVLQQLSNLATGEIENIDQREYVDIEYHSLTPPPPNLRQQFEQALPENRYRLVRISRQYLSSEQDASNAQSIQLEPPTPVQLFQNVWEKQGYAADDDVLNDFMSLVHEAEKTLEDEHNG